MAARSCTPAQMAAIRSQHLELALLLLCPTQTGQLPSDDAVRMILEAPNSCAKETRSARNHRRAVRRAAKKAGKTTAGDEESRALRWYEEGEVSGVPKS